MYVFGDSLVDVGNNNYIKGSILKANYPYNGIDYPGGIPTGRFSNGKNAADFLAERVGLPTSPPYLSNTSDVFLQGVSFASGGSGLFNTTGQGFLRETLSLSEQVDYYAEMHDRLVNQLGADGANRHLSKSLFLVVIGSNDAFAYFESGIEKNVKEVTSDEYAGQMINILQALLKQIYNLGGRKFVVVGLASVGCCPAERRDSIREECKQDINALAMNYNQRLTSMLAGLKLDLDDFNYSYFHSYTVLLDIIQNAATYGFKEVKAACCGFGKLNADAYCTPFALYCSNRTDHVFWDKFHPTQTTAGLLVDFLFSASQPYVTPNNVKQLIAL
ncbi:hypothetical protein ACH5RR_037979 [Cinchona calisaya]|uniref:GDSL esterase/lipase n=1 Tax=Cinchona calisaya TaxID=153742 RepID=A0ABD2YCH2_9GENT